MKKVVLSLAVLFSVAMVACNGNKKAEEAVDSDSIIAATEVVAVDSDRAVAAEAVEATTPAGDTVVAVEAAAETAAK